MRTGSLNIPSQGGASASAAAGLAGAAGAAANLGPGHARFDGPRSPPSTSLNYSPLPPRFRIGKRERGYKKRGKRESYKEEEEEE